MTFLILLLLHCSLSTRSLHRLSCGIFEKKIKREKNETKVTIHQKRTLCDAQRRKDSSLLPCLSSFLWNFRMVDNVSQKWLCIYRINRFFSIFSSSIFLCFWKPLQRQEKYVNFYSAISLNSTVIIGNNIQILQKIKNRIIMWSSNPTSGYAPKGIKSVCEDAAPPPPSPKHYLQ